jgi:hypothetical protein
MIKAERIAEKSLEWLISYYNRCDTEVLKNDADTFAKQYFEAILENPTRVKHYIDKYNLYKG